MRISTGLASVFFLFIGITSASEAAADAAKPVKQYRDDKHPRYSYSHHASNNAFSYCEKNAPALGHKHKWYYQNHTAFQELCASLPDNFILRANDPKVDADQCWRIKRGDAHFQACSQDTGADYEFFNMKNKCVKMVGKCFGTAKAPIDYTTGYTRIGNPAVYWGVFIEGTETAMADLGLKWKGVHVNATTGHLPQDTEVFEEEPWLQRMQMLLSDDGP